MKFFIAFLLGIFAGLTTQAQHYRLVYDKDALPEIYNQVAIYVQEQKGNGYTSLPSGKYKLNTNDGNYKNGVLTIDRKQLLQNNGLVDFTLSANGRTIALQLQLPILKSIRYNLYTDSIKPVLNYYVNVEGEFTSGRILPLDDNWVAVKADRGSIQGMEWVVPAHVDFDKVTFTTSVYGMPQLNITKTIYLKKYRDPRDAADYKGVTEEEVIRDKRRR